VSVSRSSGVNVEEITYRDVCEVCGYHGLVDAWYDPETLSGGFDCPVCTTTHERKAF
jgi:RNA polymerase subunit RPABC4/transcription elongation factor Spt4